jgi:hypothetical protein
MGARILPKASKGSLLAASEIVVTRQGVTADSALLLAELEQL